MTLSPLALYIHIPWCVQKCPYCDFNSHEKKQSLPEKAYVEAVLQDLQQDLDLLEDDQRQISSVFIGGGTPSLFSPEAIQQLLSGCRRQRDFSDDAEITLEANPGTVEAGRFAEFRAAGINRLSIGCQSFQDDSLQCLGRIHGRKQAIRAAELAHDAGFNSFNLDLMFGLPGQNLAMAHDDLATAIALEPQHLSYYQLTIEPNTLYHARPPTLPVDDLIWQIQQQGLDTLNAHGYERYEISAYAKNHQQCRHNLNYWHFGDYLGIGAGAHGKYTDTENGKVHRRWKLRHPRDYQAKAHSSEIVGGSKILDKEDLRLEFLMNALRLPAGFATELYKERTGLGDILQDEDAQQAIRDGLLETTETHLRPSRKGLDFLNLLLERFV